MTAHDHAIRFDDMPASLDINRIRLNKCRRRANAAAGTSGVSSAKAASASMYPRRVPVASMASSSTTSSRASCTREINHHTPGMEPEDGAHDFFGDQPHPVPPLHVNQLVAEHRPLHVERVRTKRVGQENERPSHAKRHRLTEADDVADLRASIEHALQLVVILLPRHDVASCSQAREPHEPDRDPRASRDDAQGEARLRARRSRKRAASSRPTSAAGTPMNAVVTVPVETPGHVAWRAWSHGRARQRASSARK